MGNPENKTPFFSKNIQKSRLSYSFELYWPVSIIILHKTVRTQEYSYEIFPNYPTQSQETELQKKHVSKLF